MVRESQRSRIVELDSLRGLAALSVLAYHFTFQLWRLAPLDDRPALSFSRGNYGVQLFFVISGFVIATSLERVDGAADFAVRRFSRLFPTYWAAVLVTSAVVGVVGLDGAYASVRNTLVNLTMLQHHARVDHVDGAYWSLAVELSFYVLAYVAHALGWLGPKRLATVLAGWMAAAALWSLLPVGSVTDRLDDLFVLRWAHLFAAGMALNALASGSGRRRSLVGIVVLAPVVELVHGSMTGAAIEAALIALVAAAVFLRPLPLQWRPLVWLGGISYALYLVHQNIGYVVIRELSGVGVGIHVAIAVATVAVTALAWALTVAVDRPGQQFVRAAWRRRHEAGTRT